MPDNLCESEYFFRVYYINTSSNVLILNLGRGGKTLWIGDGFCDDANNFEECNYDGGDCCGINVQKNFCVNCTCTGRCKLTLSIGFFAFFKKLM